MLLSDRLGLKQKKKISKSILSTLSKPSMIVQSKKTTKKEFKQPVKLKTNIEEKPIFKNHQKQFEQAIKKFKKLFEDKCNNQASKLKNKSKSKEKINHTIHVMPNSILKNKKLSNKKKIVQPTKDISKIFNKKSSTFRQDISTNSNNKKSIQFPNRNIKQNLKTDSKQIEKRRSKTILNKLNKMQSQITFKRKVKYIPFMEEQVRFQNLITYSKNMHDYSASSQSIDIHSNNSLNFPIINNIDSIIYQHSPIKQQQLHQNKQIFIKIAQRYVKTFIQCISFKQINKILMNSSQKKIIPQQSIYLNNSLSNIKLLTPQHRYQKQQQSSKSKIERILKQQQQKWLKLKQSLKNFKSNKAKIEDIIKQVQQNHKSIIELEVVDTFYQEDSPKFVKTPMKLIYDEAPVHIRQILGRNKRQQQKKSASISRQLSQKQLLNDLSMMDIISGNLQLTKKNLKTNTQSTRSQKQQQQKIIPEQLVNKIQISQTSNLLFFNVNEQIKKPKQKVINQFKKEKRFIEIELMNDDRIDKKAKKIQIVAKYQLQQNPKEFQAYCQNQKFINQITGQLYKNIADELVKYVESIQLNKFELELKPIQKHNILFYLSNNNIQIIELNGFDDRIKQFHSPLKINTNIQYIQDIFQSVFNFIYTVRYDQFKIRLINPLGMKTQHLFKWMRKLINFDEGQNSNHEIDNADLGQSQYQPVISLENISQFQELYSYKFMQSTDQLTTYQQFYNQALFDSINCYLDEFRPFGKAGLPPLNFYTNFKQPSRIKMQEYILIKLKILDSIRLGTINYAFSSIETQQIVKHSLKKYTYLTACQIEQQWSYNKQSEFEVLYQLLAQMQELIIDQQICNLSQILLKDEQWIGPDLQI